MLREVATVSPLFFKEVRPQSPLLKLFLEFYLDSFGKKLPFHQGLSVLIRFQTKLSLFSFPHDIVCRPLFSKRLSQNQVYLTLIHLSPKMFSPNRKSTFPLFISLQDVFLQIARTKSTLPLFISLQRCFSPNRPHLTQRSDPLLICTGIETFPRLRNLTHNVCRTTKNSEI